MESSEKNEAEKARAARLAAEEKEPKLTGWALRFQRQREAEICSCGRSGENCSCTEPWIGGDWE